ncbi:MAG: hypothetical protein ACE5EA_08025 [Nitrospirota bacterium]
MDRQEGHNEDEDFTLEVIIPERYKIEAVEEECNKECIEIEDTAILIMVIYYLESTFIVIPVKTGIQ